MRVFIVVLGDASRQGTPVCVPAVPRFPGSGQCPQKFQNIPVERNISPDMFSRNRGSWRSGADEATPGKWMTTNGVLMLNKSLLIAALASQLWLAQNGFAAPAGKTYQVTGQIVEVSEKMIVVQKGDERWEVARDENTKVKGALKVGQKVTIHYRMIATTVENKAQ
jgi:hypothetical protein